jgi:hypothetical protein
MLAPSTRPKKRKSMQRPIKFSRLSKWIEPMVERGAKGRGAPGQAGGIQQVKVLPR